MNEHEPYSKPIFHERKVGQSRAGKGRNDITTFEAVSTGEGSVDTDKLLDYIKSVRENTHLRGLAWHHWSRLRNKGV